MNDLRSSLKTMTSGDRMLFEGVGGTHTVSYYERPSYGDNGSPVFGATVGEYTVTDDRGKVREYAHGPHATTAAAARRGANPNAKAYAADQAASAIISAHFRAQHAALGLSPAPAR